MPSHRHRLPASEPFWRSHASLGWSWNSRRLNESESSTSRRKSPCGCLDQLRICSCAALELALAFTAGVIKKCLFCLMCLMYTESPFTLQSNVSHFFSNVATESHCKLESNVSQCV